MAEWSKAPVLKTGDVKASVGSNPTLSANLIPTGYVQKYPSGRRGSPAKGVGCVKSAARVQIPPSAPTKSPRRQAGGFCWHLEGFEDELQWPAPMGPGLGATYGVCRRSAAGGGESEAAERKCPDAGWAGSTAGVGWHDETMLRS